MDTHTLQNDLINTHICLHSSMLIWKVDPYLLLEQDLRYWLYKYVHIQKPGKDQFSEVRNTNLKYPMFIELFVSNKLCLELFTCIIHVVVNIFLHLDLNIVSRILRNMSNIDITNVKINPAPNH